MPAIREHKFDTWSECRSFLEEDLNPAYTLFRGQFDATWGLCTSLDRQLSLLPSGFRNDRVVQLHLKRFIRATRGRLNIARVDMDEIEWWAIGQHYGLATPLLDWTESAYIAAYFAFAPPGKSPSSRRAIWALVPNGLDSPNVSIRESYSSLPHSSDEFIEKHRAPTVEIVDPTSGDNPRIVNQAGMFTRSPILWNLENWIKRHEECISVPVLLKLSIDDDARYEVLSALQKMNIHSQSMFPDLFGASVYCNETLSLQADVVTTYKEAFRLLRQTESDG